MRDMTGWDKPSSQPSLSLACRVIFLPGHFFIVSEAAGPIEGRTAYS
jgi:hypothetical protein